MCEDGWLNLSVIPLGGSRGGQYHVRIDLEDCKFNCRVVLPNFGSLCSRSIHIICSLIAEDFARIIVNPIFAPFQISWFQRAEIRSFRQKSAQNTVPVLVAPTLPTTERMCVVHFIALYCFLQPSAIQKL